MRGLWIAGLAGALALPAAAEPTKAEVKRSYTAAVTWLVEHQSADGRWDADGWSRKADDWPREGTEFGDSRYDVGLTALALLALLETEQPGDEVQASLTKGLEWLKAQQQADGSLGFEASHGESIYNHAAATLALCRAVAKKHPVQDAAQRGLEFCAKARNPGLGWKYGVKSGRNDTSVTSWMLICLRAGKRAKLKLEPFYEPCWAGGTDWIARATAKNGEVGYESPGGGSAFLMQNDGKFDPLPVMNAAALHALGGDHQAAGALAGHLDEELPSWGAGGNVRKVNFYYWYHGTLGLKALGGESWRAWKASVLEALLPNQAGKGPQEGSWPPVAEWCLAGGRVYATAINALTVSACR